MPKYISWWSISDIDFKLTGMCENMVRIISHSSQLKMDDATLKTSMRSSIICTKCDLNEMEDIKHIVMSCPDSKSDIDEMYTEIHNIPAGSGSFFLDTCEHSLPVLLGKHYEPLCFEQMVPIWNISGKCVNKLYTRRVKERSGVG